MDKCVNCNSPDLATKRHCEPCRVKHNAACRKSDSKHSDERKAARKKWKQENPEKVHEQYLRKKERSPKFYSEAQRRRRSKFKQQNPEGYAASRQAESVKRINGPKREEILAKQRAYNVANWDTKGKAYRDAWRKKNWDRLKAVYNGYYRKRRALLAGAEGTFTEDEWLAITERQHGRCFDCGEERKLTIGHLVPLSKGGSNWPTNIVGQCLRCNSKQGTKIHPSIEGEKQ